jgi:diaminohydroxyphosphoribosylaminopyrimidine deaminase/5-amino-6-(5-phosphoribosylamino)uracil reductase
MAARKAVVVDPEFDRRVMAAALRLGRRGLGETGANPAVGCIIVKVKGGARIVVGRGVTARGGRPHAERMALAEAGGAAKGATVYVTLEPCAHQRKDGPCAGALIEAGVGRVVSAMADPDPRTAGKGHAALAAAGVAVTTGVLAEDAARAHSGHIARILKGRPHVTLKLAVSADGMIGRRGGERFLVSGKQSFDAVQVMRTAFDTVMVGVGTVIEDDPRLTVRLARLEHRSPRRVIVDAKARTPANGKLFEAVKDVPLLVFVGPEAPAERVAALQAGGAEVIAVDLESGKLDLAAVLERLAKEGSSRVLAEGGAEVAASLVGHDLVDEVVLIHAPVVVGPDGVRALAGMALSAIERNPRYRLVEASPLGEDLLRRYLRVA